MQRSLLGYNYKGVAAKLRAAEWVPANKRVPGEVQAYIFAGLDLRVEPSEEPFTIWSNRSRKESRHVTIKITEEPTEVEHPQHELHRFLDKVVITGWISDLDLARLALLDSNIGAPVPEDKICFGRITGGPSGGGQAWFCPDSESPADMTLYLIVIST